MKLNRDRHYNIYIYENNFIITHKIKKVFGETKKKVVRSIRSILLSRKKKHHRITICNNLK